MECAAAGKTICLDAPLLCGIQNSLSTLEIPQPRRLAVLGVGLLGASVLRAARARLPGVELSAWSRSVGSRDAVKDIAVVHASPEAAVAGADCVVLAGPVDALPSLLQAIGNTLPAQAWVTDVGSTKRGVHAAAKRLLSRPGRFIGGHPMAGSERGGAAEGRADLLVGRPCIVTADTSTDPDLPAKAEALWSGLGGKVVHLSPAEHDDAVAAISHLPHATACILAHLLSKGTPRLDLAAGGLRDTTRVAAGDPALWIPILLENADHLVPLLAGLEQASSELRAALSERDADAIGRYLTQARSFRQGLDRP